MKRTDNDQVKRAFARIKMRELIGIAVGIVAVLLPALIWRRPDLFGVVSKKDIIIAQLVVILLFANFTSWNWRCPSCKRYLGNDIGTSRCRKCGTHLV